MAHAPAFRFPRRRGSPAALGLLVVLTSASCVPATLSASPAPAPASPSRAAPAIPVRLAAAPAPAPAAEPLAAAPSHVFRARTPLDRMRSLDCLAEAVYYEARSETEEGQKAVAQVVLNRVRHPAWPNSVCGVVYQGPLRPGGGCQFTFTCDGSLAVRPRGLGWAEARRIAAAALAGATYAPVGLSTHYHTDEVSPHWAPRLARTIEIGAHNFYRLPGAVGEAAAFRAAYSGTEPLPVPSTILPRRLPRAELAALPDWVRPPEPAGQSNAAPPPEAAAPPSTVREEYRHSGQWRADAPKAITGP